MLQDKVEYLYQLVQMEKTWVYQPCVLLFMTVLRHVIWVLATADRYIWMLYFVPLLVFRQGHVCFFLDGEEI